MIILDTHTLVWLTSNPDKLSLKAAKIISQEVKRREICVSSISIWEIASLVRKNKLEFSIGFENWLREVEDTPTVRFIPVDNKIASDSIFLPGKIHKDPADRIIIATARNINAKVVTKDSKIRKYKYVRSVW